MTIECSKCKIDTKKRKLIKRYPLSKIDVKNHDGYEEYYCFNTIKTRRKGRKVNQWFEEECRNRILVKKR